MPKILRRSYTQKKHIGPTGFDRQHSVNGSYRFVDNFPLVHGTLPEKIVYNALSRFGIPFYFLNDVDISLPQIEFQKYYQADFVIPSLKLIIEVQGAYWHSKPKTIESDALKFAYYELSGYTVYDWWDYQILSGVDQLIINSALLMSVAKPQTVFASQELTPLRRTKIDSSKGIRTLNKKRGFRNAYKRILKFK